MERSEGSDEAEGELEFGSSKCRCPKCGTTVPHTDRGIPCSKRVCPECGANMRGTQCMEERGT